MTAAALRLFTSESVTEGHPDKICDQISDSILDALLTVDPNARVAVETMVTTGLVHVAGEVTTSGYVEIPKLVRDVITGIGYNSSDVSFDGATCGVEVSIGAQSPDIAQGVDESLDSRTGAVDPLDRQGAGDQGIMFGFATNETPEYMPVAIWLAHRLAERLAAVRKSGELSFLRPDGKTQVTIGYDGVVPKTVETVVLSTQHSPSVTLDELTAAITEHVIRPVLDLVDLDSSHVDVIVNPTGRFEIGGPQGDAGLTGRKVIVDTLCDVWGLRTDGDLDAAGTAVEAHVGRVVPDAGDDVTDELRDLHVAGGRDLARDVHEPGRHHRLDGDPSVRVDREQGVKDGVGDLVADLVRVTLGHRFRREQSKRARHRDQSVGCCCLVTVSLSSLISWSATERGLSSIVESTSGPTLSKSEPSWRSA